MKEIVAMKQEEIKEKRWKVCYREKGMKKMIIQILKIKLSLKKYFTNELKCGKWLVKWKWFGSQRGKVKGYGQKKKNVDRKEKETKRE